jgi:CO dehydrogenase/acetyl-CoA synthase beta subunit
LEKETNALLEEQVKELKEKLNGKIVQKELQAGIEIEELTKTIKDLREHLDNVEKNYKEKLNECKKQQG